MSALLMLRHLNEHEAANRAERAMLAVFAEGKVLTRDLGGAARTEEFANAIIDKLRAGEAAKA